MALHYAIKVSHLNLVLPLLDKDANLAAEDKHGWSVLHYDVRYGDLAITHFPIKGEARAREKQGWTVLHLAARKGQAEKARLLRENGEDVTELQTSGTVSTLRYGQPDTISTLLEHYGEH